MCQSSVDPTLILRHATKWDRVFCSLEALECIMITIGNGDFNRTVNKPDTGLKMYVAKFIKNTDMEIQFFDFSFHVFYSWLTV